MGPSLEIGSTIRCQAIRPMRRTILLLRMTRLLVAIHWETISPRVAGPTKAVRQAEAGSATMIPVVGAAEISVEEISEEVTVEVVVTLVAVISNLSQAG